MERMPGTIATQVIARVVGAIVVVLLVSTLTAISVKRANDKEGGQVVTAGGNDLPGGSTTGGTTTGRPTTAGPTGTTRPGTPASTVAGSTSAPGAAPTGGTPGATPTGGAPGAPAGSTGGAGPTVGSPAPEDPAYAPPPDDGAAPAPDPGPADAPAPAPAPAGCTDENPAIGVYCDRIVVGGTTVLSGPLGIYGQQGLSAGQAWLAYYNTQVAPRVGMRQVELKWYDDGADPQRCLTAVKRLVEEDRVLYLPGITSPEGTAEYLAQNKVPLIGDIGLSNKSFENPYIWPTRLDNRQLALLTIKYLKETYNVQKVARIDAPLPGVDTTDEDQYFLQACEQYQVECNNDQKIQTDQADCNGQMNAVIRYRPNMVIMPTAAAQWLACTGAARTQQYFNFGDRRGANPASLDLIPPGFFGGSAIQAEADQCRDFCVGMQTAGLFIDPDSAGYETPFLNYTYNAMQTYRANMAQSAPNVDKTSLISINYYFVGPIFAQLAWNIQSKGLPLNRDTLRDEANNFDFDPGSGAEIHWHDPVRHSAWNCGYIYNMEQSANGYKWVFPVDKSAKYCTD